jgi:hypothetical protein
LQTILRIAEQLPYARPGGDVKTVQSFCHQAEFSRRAESRTMARV